MFAWNSFLALNEGEGENVIIGIFATTEQELLHSICIFLAPCVSCFSLVTLPCPVSYLSSCQVFLLSNCWPHPDVSHLCLIVSFLKEYLVLVFHPFIVLVLSVFFSPASASLCSSCYSSLFIKFVCPLCRDYTKHIFVCQNGHNLRLSIHSGINSCHVLVWRLATLQVWPWQIIIYIPAQVYRSSGRQDGARQETCLRKAIMQQIECQLQ